MGGFILSSGQKKIAAVIFIIIALAALHGYRSSEPIKSEREGYKLGTIVHLTVYGSDKNKNDAILDRAMAEISRLEGLLSVNIPSSEVSHINESAGLKAVAAGDETMALLRQALAIASLTEGAFDPTVGAVVKLWGIGTDHPRLPHPSEIKKALSTVDYRMLQLNGGKGSVYAVQGQRVDLGAIAKGYIADRVCAFIKKEGVKSAIVDLGGNLAVVGRAPSGSLWRLGLQHPLKPRGEYFAVIETENESVVTSGPYERYFDKDGVRYHHIFDTKTGYPASSDLSSVSIVAQNSADSDAYCTALFVMGLRSARLFLKEHRQIEAVLVDKSAKRIFITEGLKNKISLRDSSMKIIAAEDLEK